MEAIRRRRAQEAMARRALLELAHLPEVILRSVLAMGGSLLLAYEPVGGRGESSTIVTQDPGPLVRELLERWCAACAVVALEIDPLGERIRLTRTNDDARVELSMRSTHPEF